jgi:sugar phosphate permease
MVLLWGVVVGLGVGSTALVFGALVANRWFVRNRGLVMGIFGAAFSTGQLIFLPSLARLIENSGWRAASLVIAVLATLLIPLVIIVFRDRPSDIGLRPYGATGDPTPDELVVNSHGGGGQAVRHALTTLVDAMRTGPFWLLAGTFAVCGWTTNGIVSTHFVPTTHDHGMASTTAASLLAVVGIFDIIGTIGSGWFTDRIDPRYLLAVYYVLRGVALAATPIILGPDVQPSLLVVMVFIGLDWVATVPPTAVLCRRIYGVERGAIVFGWVFAAHMIGAAAAATVSGVMRQNQGNYQMSWFLAAGLAVIAGFAALALPRPSAPVLVRESVGSLR